MPKLLLSQVKAAGYDADTLAAAVENYRLALLQHRFTGDAAPSPEQSWMEALVKRVQYPVEEQRPDEFVEDYEIVDDTPSPPSFRDKKRALYAKVQGMEQEAINELLPPGKTRMLMNRVNEALAVPEDQRTVDQVAALDGYRDYTLKCAEFSRHASALMVEVDDLTEDAIDGWEPAPFEI